VFPKYVLLSIHAFFRVPLGAYTFFSKTGVMINESFSKERLEVNSFQKRAGFFSRKIYFLFLFVFVFFLSFFFMRYFAT